MVKLAPSILSADFGALGREIERVAPETDLVHVDVMDGHFVPNLTIGPPVVKSLRRHTAEYLECHLMVTNPWDLLEDFAVAGANRCSVHVEVGKTEELIQQMRDLNLSVGLALNPETPFDDVYPYLGRIDTLLVMSVHPGFGGQSFIESVLEKARLARETIDREGLELEIEIDGGINNDTAPLACEAGVEILVAGSAIFGSFDPLAAATQLRESACRRPYS